MILTGPEIQKQIEAGRISVSPYNQARVNPNSYDLGLGREVGVYSDWVSFTGRGSIQDGACFVPSDRVLDTKLKPEFKKFAMDLESGWVLKPGILYLMHTDEVVTTDHYVPILDGKSSIARLGIVVHLTAGFGDIHFKGQYTLEVTTVHPVRVYPGMRFCQIRFHQPVGDILPYEGNYTGERATGPVESRCWKQFGT